MHQLMGRKKKKHEVFFGLQSNDKSEIFMSQIRTVT